VIGCLDKPDAGQVVIGGRDVTGQALHKLAGLRQKFFGYVFQTFNLIPVLSAYENVEFPLLLDGGSGAADRKGRVEALLERVGLADHRHHRPNQLSGGQRQRVAIARALVARPLAVLADEPTANLDSKTAGEIVDLMADLNTSEHVTFVFATHDPHIISKAGRVVWMADGAIQQDVAAVELAQVS
jgi:putative ABC transport system ATP-binding protein